MMLFDQYFFTDVDLSILCTPPPHVHQVCLCTAFSTSRSLCSTSRMFLIDFSRFRDKKTHLMMTIFILSSFFSIFSIDQSVANWPPLPPSLHRRAIRKRQKTYKGIFLPPSWPLSVYVWGLILRIWEDDLAAFL